MPLTITDDMLTSAGLSEQDAKLEIACRLYDAGRLNMPQATRWAGVGRIAFEAALLERGLPLVRIGEEYWQQELDGMRQLGWSP
jgi:predicted HTH domain antitoxin